MDSLLRIRRVAENLEISERTVRNWISKGILRRYPVEGTIFLDWPEVVEDLKAHGSANSLATSAKEEPGEYPDNE